MRGIDPVPRKYAAIGEKVKIIVPKEFIRCGYPLSIEVIKQTRGKEVSEKIYNAALAIGALSDKTPAYIDKDFGVIRSVDNIDLHPNLDQNIREYLTPRIYRNLEFAVCSTILEQERWGGSERAIHEIDRPALAGLVGTVTKKEIVKTGQRYAASGGYDGYSGEYDYEPGGLYDMKTHCVYTIMLNTWLIEDLSPMRDLKVVAANCEVVNDSTK